MNQTLKNVEEFHLTFGAPVLEKPMIPDMARIKLRLTLILEELAELAQASGAESVFMDLLNQKLEKYLPQPEQQDPVEVVDALCDLQVVLNGTILEFGLQNNFDEAFEEVHRSNMSKSCETEEEGSLSTEKYKIEGIPVQLEMINGRHVIYRKSDHKILKGVNFTPPDLEKYFNQDGKRNA